MGEVGNKGVVRHRMPTLSSWPSSVLRILSSGRRLLKNAKIDIVNLRLEFSSERGLTPTATRPTHWI